MANILTRKMMHDFDRDGNEAIVMVDKIGNQLAFEFGGKVSLKIRTEGNRKRNIGFIKNDTLHVNREAEHVFLKTNSFGFNYNLLVMTDIFSHVSIVYNGKFYRIPKKSIVDYGKVMNFKESTDGNSFELQIFLPLQIIMNYKIDIENAVPNREDSAQ